MKRVPTRTEKMNRQVYDQFVHIYSLTHLYFNLGDYIVTRYRDLFPTSKEELAGDKRSEMIDR